MSEEDKVPFDVTIDDVVKVDVEDGDVLLVSLPETANQMPRNIQDAFSKNVSDAFQNVFSDKAIKVVVVPHGMEVQVIKGSELEDKVNDASE